MQVLFERERHSITDTTTSLARNVSELGECDEEFAGSLLDGIITREGELKSAVQERAPQWPLERMDPISRCVLLVGAFELLFRSGDAPPAVVMNEAIDIAKEYGTPEGGKFVNGVLNAIAKKNG